MNEPNESLERELAFLQPQQPSAELRRRIEHELSAVQPSNRPSPAAVWSLVMTVAALAACFLIAVLPQNRNGIVQPHPNPTTAESPIPSDSLPTFWAYHRAVTAPTQSLDSLLDRHADRSLAADDALLHVHAFSTFPSQNQSDRGGL
jgi:hypothetical protein